MRAGGLLARTLFGRCFCSLGGWWVNGVAILWLVLVEASAPVHSHVIIFCNNLIKATGTIVFCKPRKNKYHIIFLKLLKMYRFLGQDADPLQRIRS